MNLYNENENVISSDEYTDEDDDNALMNDAVRAQDYKFPSSGCTDWDIKPKWRIDQKQKELSSLIRRNKISVIYKNKSIKWLNNKKQRELYKNHIFLNAKKNGIGQMISSAVASFDEEEEKNTKEERRDQKYGTIEEVFSVEDEDTEFTNNYSNKEIKEVKKESQGLSTFKCISEVLNTQAKTDSDIADKTIAENEKLVLMKEVKKNAEKRTRSTSPSILTEGTDNEIRQNEKKLRTDSPQIYNSINEMFPKFDKIVTNHIGKIANSTLSATEEKMKCLSNEIDTLNDILHTKEMEWNRLVHLKMVKEEIYSRLSQKRQLFYVKDRYTKKQCDNSLLDLKELEIYLSDNQKSNSLETNHSSISIQKLIENRANMNTEDLELEKNNTSRLHSLLVSRHMLHGPNSNQNTSAISNGEKNTNSEFVKNADRLCLLSNKDSQGGFRNVKSLIADFRERNPELLPRAGRRISSNESNAQHHSFNIPLFTKASSGLQCLAKDDKAEFFPLRNSVEFASTTPIERAKQLLSNHDIDFVKAKNNHYNIRLEEKYLKNQAKRGFDEKCPVNIQYPVCQECKFMESRFVCAGCGNQWYCSKKCQISAWDKHSDLCTD